MEENQERYNSISDLAQLLENELRKRIPEIDVGEYPKGDSGIHLAGYEAIGDHFLPTFWHIHNSISEALPDKKIYPAIVNANNDISPKKGRDIAEGNIIVTIRNGDTKAYIALFELLFKPRSPFSEIVTDSFVLRKNSCQS